MLERVSVSPLWRLPLSYAAMYVRNRLGRRISSAVISGLLGASMLAFDAGSEAHAATQKFADRSRAAWHTFLEPPVLEGREFFGTQHDLESFRSFEIRHPSGPPVVW